MPTTYELTVNDAGDPEAVPVRTPCTLVICKEKPDVANWPHKVKHQKVLGDTPVLNVDGSSVLFRGNFLPRDNAGYLSLVSGDGSTTFCIEETNEE